MPAILAILLLPFFYFLAMSAVALLPVAILGACAAVLGRIVWNMYVKKVEQAMESARKSVPFADKVLPELVSAQDVQDLVLHEQAEAEIAAEIEEVVKTAEQMPKTAPEAAERLRVIQEEVRDLEQKLACVEADAKTRSGGWMVVAEARQKLEHAKAREEDALDDFNRFPAQLTAASSSAGGKSTSFGQPPSEDVADLRSTIAAVNNMRFKAGVLPPRMGHFQPQMSAMPCRCAPFRLPPPPPIRPSSISLSCRRPLLLALRRL
jgi:hypothetical protein